MKTAVRLKSVFPPDLVTKMRERADAVLGEIYGDYFSAKSFDDFRFRHTGHNSLIMKIASYRFITGDLFSKLRDCLRYQLAEVYRDHEISEILLHPIFYLRFSWPDIIYSDQENRTFLDSQPHYDCSYGVFAYSFWMPLEDTDHETGGLCYFQDDDIFDYFPPTMTRNRLNFDRYVEAAPEIDPMLRRGVVAPSLRAGDALTFDSSVLHGATKPTKRRWVSFDFRLIPPSYVKDTKKKIQRLFNEVNRSVDMTNAQNLIILGDFLGASRIYERMAAKTGNAELSRIAEVFRKRQADQEILQARSQMQWQKEYFWLLGDSSGN